MEWFLHLLAEARGVVALELHVLGRIDLWHALSGVERRRNFEAAHVVVYRRWVEVLWHVVLLDGRRHQLWRLVCSAIVEVRQLLLLTVLAHHDRLRAGQLGLPLRRGEVRRRDRVCVADRLLKWHLGVVRRRILPIGAIRIVRVWLLHI